LICKYFRAAVLPADKELYAEIFDTDQRRQCGDCLRLFVPERKNNLYCKPCVVKRERTRKREWARKNTGRK
jgi:hypothetical protein